MQSPDHPELVYIQAAGYTVGRPDGPPIWIVVHDMEATETDKCAENTAVYFANGAGGRNVSSHYTADNNSVVQCVLLRNSAWTVGNRPGNNRGINWELCGFASQSRAQWLDPFGLAMFNQIAPILAADATTYSIPLVKRTVAELQQFRPGITSHNDLRLAFGGTTHTDPGANFPWDVFLDMMRGADMATPAEVWAYDVDPATAGAYTASGALYTTFNRAGALANVQVPALQSNVDALTAKVDAMDAKLDLLLAAGAGGTSAHIHDLPASTGGITP